MKCFVSLIAVIFSVLSACAQWEVVRTGIAFYDIQFTSEDTGYAVGWCSCLYKTIDGGDSWFGLAADYGTGRTLHFPTNETGYIVGGYWEELYKTTDGGQTIVNKAPPFGSLYSTAHFFSPDTGWIGEYTASPRIVGTNDGADNFFVVGVGGGKVKYIQFTSRNVGYMLGSHGFSDKVVFHTNDGGFTWMDFETDIFPGWFFEDIFFVNDSVGYGSFNASLFKTTDSSRTWTAVPHDLPNLGWGFGSSTGFTEYRKALHFVTEDIGYGWGGDRIFRTENGGINWIETHIQNPRGIREIFCLNADTCFAAGIDFIYKTTNGGGQLITSAEQPQAAQPGFTLYPNPASEQINISLHKPTTATTTLQITNSLGAVVAVQELPRGTRSQRLDVSYLTAGVYHVSVAGQPGQRLVKW